MPRRGLRAQLGDVQGNIGQLNASTKPSQRLPHDELYRRVREYLEREMRYSLHARARAERL